MTIEVWTKEKYAASEESALIARLAHAGLAVKEARLSRLYRIEAPFPDNAFRRIGADLLTDRITERFSLAGRPGLKRFRRVEVWLKPSVTDVVGESVQEAVRDIMGGRPESVRFGRAYYVRCASEEKLRRAAAAALVNDIVNVYGIG